MLAAIFLLCSMILFAVKASVPPIQRNLCGNYPNGTKIQPGFECDDRRLCSNDWQGNAVCKCNWIKRLFPASGEKIDGLHDGKCKCEDFNGPKWTFVEVGGKCVCPDNKSLVPFCGCVEPETTCPEGKVKVCYDLTGCFADGAIKYRNYRENCSKPCVPRCVPKEVVDDPNAGGLVDCDGTIMNG